MLLLLVAMVGLVLFVGAVLLNAAAMALILAGGLLVGSIVFGASINTEG